MKHAKKALIGLIAVFFLLMSSVSQISGANEINDDANDVWKVTYTAGGAWSSTSKGDFHDEIDFESIAIIDEGNGNKSIQIAFGAAPVIDEYHGYYGFATVTISGVGITAATITFWAGSTGTGGTEINSSLIIANTQLSLSVTADNAATIDLTSLKFSYDEDYWPSVDLSSWDMAIWSFYSSEGWQESWSSGEAYWDYYPDDTAPFETEEPSTPSTSGTENPGIQFSPGFSIVDSSLALVTIAGVMVITRVYLKKRGKK